MATIENTTLSIIDPSKHSDGKVLKAGMKTFIITPTIVPKEDAAAFYDDNTATDARQQDPQPPPPQQSLVFGQDTMVTTATDGIVIPAGKNNQQQHFAVENPFVSRRFPGSTQQPHTPPPVYYPIATSMNVDPYIDFLPPQAPKRSKSSYMFFSTHKHTEIRSELEQSGDNEQRKMNTTDVAKMVSKARKEMPEEEREKWEEIVRLDKKRYEREELVYTGPWKVPIVLKKSKKRAAALSRRKTLKKSKKRRAQNQQHAAMGAAATGGGFKPGAYGGPFTREEDILLWTSQQQAERGEQHKWTTIAETAFHYTRSQHQIKNRWYSASFKKFVVNEFGLNAYEYYTRSSSVPNLVGMSPPLREISPEQLAHIDDEKDSERSYDSRAIFKRRASIGWTPEEDVKVTELVKWYGDKKWTFIARQMNERSGKQCRERWCNHLNPDINKGEWTSEEDKALIQAHAEIGNRWVEISKRLMGRTDNAIKNRWNTTLKRIMNKEVSPSLPASLSKNRKRKSTSAAAAKGLNPTSAADGGASPPLSGGPTVFYSK